jgi:hypothetical protein
MRPFVIVCPKPLCREQLGMFDAAEAVQVQPLMPDSSIKSFDVGILCWLTWLDVQQLDLLLSGPIDQILTDVFWTVVATQCQGFPAPLDDLLQRTNNAPTG